MVMGVLYRLLYLYSMDISVSIFYEQVAGNIVIWLPQSSGKLHCSLWIYPVSIYISDYCFSMSKLYILHGRAEAGTMGMEG